MYICMISKLNIYKCGFMNEKIIIAIITAICLEESNVPLDCILQNPVFEKQCIYLKFVNDKENRNTIEEFQILGIYV